MYSHLVLFFFKFNLISHSLQGKLFDVPICASCDEHVGILNEEQTMAHMASLLCHHSKVAANIIRDFSNPVALEGWLELAEGEEGEEEEGRDLVCILHRKKDKSAKSQHLAVVFINSKNRTSLLCTTGKQVTPTCSSCSSVGCHCVRAWKRKVKEEEEEIEEAEKAGAELESEDINENNEQQVDEEAHYRMRDAHYSYNLSDIQFPLHSCPQQKTILDKKKSGAFAFPPVILPKYDENRTCKKHQNKYRKDDHLAKIWSRYIVVYHERGETMYEVDVFCRETEGNCNCKQQFDGHEFLVLHVGGGKCVDYVTLQSYLLSMVNGGTTAYAFHKTIADNCKSLGNNFGLNYRTFLQACDGFVENLKFDLKSCFSCTNCGTAPKYFVGDGKADIAPLQRKMKNRGIKELSPHPEDKNILSQGSKHEDRMFLADKKERDKVCDLLTGSISVEFFCSSVSLTSSNGKLVEKVVTRLSKDFTDVLPQPYQVFLTDACKNSPVAGYIQVTRNRPLVLLRQFCIKQLDARNGHHQEELSELKSQLPSLWKQLVDICVLENSSFLPHDVSAIVLAMLNIRKQTYRGGEERYKDDYISFDKTGIYEENQTQFYPMHRLKTYPKLYKVSKKNRPRVL